MAPTNDTRAGRGQIASLTVSPEASDVVVMNTSVVSATLCFARVSL
jgi:hypothetical protein